MHSYISARGHQLALNYRDTAELVPHLGRKPAILKNWLIGARRAQIALLIAVLAGPTVLVAAVDLALEAIYPPQTTSRLLGLWEETYPDPRLEQHQASARVLLGVGASGLVLALLWLHIPIAVSQARQLARKFEAEADSLSTTDPGRSVVLYRSALALETGPERETALEQKLNQLSRQLGSPVPDATDSSTLASTADGGAADTALQATVVISQTQRLGLPSATVGHDSRYRVEQELGRGAMGIVYRALDTRLDRPVALKQLFAHHSGEPELARRFRNEARVLARLSHPHIVQVHDFFEDGSGAWIAMELVDGDTLDRGMGNGPTPVAEVVRIGIELATALDYAHAQGVVHRDFKPGNVLIDADGRCKISDFGIAKCTESSVHTQAGTILGSPAYMSPEQARGDEVDERTDIYALGVTLYRMATGQLPFRGDAKSVLAQVLTQTPPSPRKVQPTIPVALSKLILKLMAKDPGQRPTRGAEVATALRKLGPVS